ncbi:MAG TPA: YkgJ family cysteine cluster protein [Methanoregula sp.]|nr:YkgJ family cysteine cluster protein [Methanoregula sp.]
MVTFVCNGCGKCCTSLGAYIRIERQLTSTDYYCRNGITGEVFPVHVQPAFADEIDDEYTSGQWDAPGSRKGCIFMRKNPDGPGVVCAIYPTRPQICREFRCYHLVIFNSRGTEAGRMVGKTDIQTTDQELARIWNDEIKPLATILTTQKQTDHKQGLVTPLCSNPEWMQKASVILSFHGYRAEPVT